jgi:hypothetical protein
MQPNTSNGKKQGSIDNKTAVIKVEEPGGDVRVFEAQHYIKNSGDGTISIYEGPRSDGIDYQAHVERCTIDRVDTHEDSDDEERRLVTDGGRPRKVVVHCDYCTAGMSVKPETDTPDQGWKCKQCWQAEKAGTYDQKALDIIEDADVEPGDRVEYDGREWVFVHYCMDHHTTLVPVGLVARDETVERPVDVRELDTVKDSSDGSDDPYNHYDPVMDGHPDDELELVTDGGRELVSGDDVFHAGEQYRVARSDGARVEIYQLGTRSLIVPIDTVDPVPEVRA